MATHAETVAGLREFVERLQRDIAGADPAAVIGIYDLGSESWIIEPSPDRPEPPEDFGPDGLVGRIYGSDFLLSGDDPAEFLAHLADRVQDDVIDELGRSWPDVEHDGRTVHLEPVVQHGVAAWGYRGQPVRAIGELNATL
ncbi:hypothetical protein [Microlunatus parietis]|uniref:Uncharacterized protein n=1 Tax=Microlunatus parietis TaxID=682979 RepID=A0A7Y9LD97_9ACTN|nr:hypothetical protein [Microlunatus parietis]NYE73667.1 hypothetical protein [Microlunatus parietis]